MSMATVNFSVPDEIKEAFNRAFAKQNKSAVIAGLMRKAVEEQGKQKRRQEAFRILTARRSLRTKATDEEIRAAREEGRQ
jgi:metal-responsive CopG/Arc/MetJ family transcriptional regulator